MKLLEIELKIYLIHLKHKNNTFQEKESLKNGFYTGG
jgi:hypothetical protein